MGGKVAMKEQIQSLIRQVAEHQEFSGVVLVQHSDNAGTGGSSEVFCGAYGEANRTWKVKNRPTTRFRIASVGKMFTAVAILQLIEAGKLSLETRVLDALELTGTRLPAELTVFHLLSMTSGIADWIDEDADDYDEEWAQFCRQHPLYLFHSDADYLPIFTPLAPYFPLGERFRYNGAGFMLLGLLIEKISGQSYFEYVRRQVFARAGMSETDFSELDEVLPNVAEGYVPVLDANEKVTGWKKNYYRATIGPAADGGATSTLADLLRFSQALRQGELIGPKLVHAMTSAQAVQDEKDEQGCQWGYGFGCFVMLDEKKQVLRWGHTGEEDGVSCRLWHYPQQEITVVILGNQSLCAGKISSEIHRLVMDS